DQALRTIATRDSGARSWRSAEQEHHIRTGHLTRRRFPPTSAARNVVTVNHEWCAISRGDPRVPTVAYSAASAGRRPWHRRCSSHNRQRSLRDPPHTFETSCDHHSHWAPVDRYQPCFELASGGMATVYLARVTARAGFDRFVALKRIHPHLVKEPGFVE